MEICAIGLILTYVFGGICLAFHFAINANINRATKLLNLPISLYNEIIEDAIKKHIQAIDNLSSWRDGTFYGFLVVAFLEFILICFGY